MGVATEQVSALHHKQMYTSTHRHTHTQTHTPTHTYTTHNHKHTHTHTHTHTERLPYTSLAHAHNALHQVGIIYRYNI